MRVIALLCVASFALANAGPAGWLSEYTESCAIECAGSSNPKFKYQRDTTYFYDYSVTTPFTLKDGDALTINARAEIQVIDDCEFALRLKDVGLVQKDLSDGRTRYPSRGDEFQRALEQNTLRFSFVEGVIKHVCPESGESIWSLNFKRGLLSSFQNSMDRLETNQRVNEVDVTGECEAEYNVSKTWGWRRDINIKKSKDLTACSQRDGCYSIIQSVLYKVPSEIQSNPIVKSSLGCEYTIDGETRILKSAKCQETHLLNPVTSQEGAKVEIKQQLTFKSTKQGVDSGRVSVTDRRSLAFQHVNEPKSIKNGREAAEEKVKEICQQTREDVRPETPRLFSELVDIVKGLNEVDLQGLHQLLKDKSICPDNEKAIKFFYDALPMAANTGSVQMMSLLIRDGEIDGLLARAWLSSLAFVKEPSRVMIQEAANLVQSSWKEDAILPMTAMAHTYLKNNPDAVDDNEVVHLSDALRREIPRSCAVDQKSVADVLRVLKGIGNLGPAESLSDTLDICLSSHYTPMQVKLAAAEAYRRMACKRGERDDELWKKLNDANEDSELRIASYLAIMRCPDDATLSKVSSLLQKEDDEQVGAFIYSHLKNIRESSDPLKQDLAEAVSRLSLKEFEINALKHSRNHEASVLLNKLNAGFTADGDVIMDSKSPLPRSARANLTIDLFGQSVNLLEVGGRAEGLEYLLERLLGPYGYFPSSGSSQNNEKLSDVKATVYARVFGNDVAFKHMEGFEGFPKKMELPNIMDLLVKKQRVSWTHSQQIMDVSLVLPTIAGLPLALTVNGTATFNLQAHGKVDLRKMSASPRSLEIDGYFRPSAAMEITGSFVLDAFATKTGLRMRTTIHSSTGINGNIKLTRGNNLNIEIDPPKDNMEVFNGNSEFFALTDGVEEKIPTDNKESRQRDYTYCSGETVSHALGVKLCGQIEYPVASRSQIAPYSPLAGPTKFSIVSYRTDTHNKYKLLVKTVQKKDTSSAQFLMATPGSKINRVISTDLSITHSSDKRLDFSFVSPWKKVTVNGVFMDNKEIFSASSSVLIDDKDKYGLTTELKKSKNKRQQTFVPFVELTMGGRATTLLSGQVDVELPQSVDVNLQIQPPANKPYELKGVFLNKKQQKRVTLTANQVGKDQYMLTLGSSVERNGKGGRNIHLEPELTVKTPETTLVTVTGSADYKPEKSMSGNVSLNVHKMKPASVLFEAKKTRKGKLDKYDVGLNVKSSWLSCSLDTDHFFRGKSLTSTVKLNYNIPKVSKDIITWSGKIRDKSNKALTKYTINSNLNSKKNPHVNTGVKLDIDHKKKKHSSANLEIKYGANPKDKKKVINLSTALTRNIKNIKNADLNLKFKASAPQKNVDFYVVMSHSHSPKKLASEFEMKARPLLKDKVDFVLNLADKGGKLGKWTGDLSLNVPGKKLSVDTDLTQKSSKQYVHTANIMCSGSGTHSMVSVYKYRGKNIHEVTSSVNVAGAERVKMEARTKLDPSNFEASSSIKRGKDIYSANVQSKIVKNSAGKWSVELVHPNRKIEASLDGENMKDKYAGRMVLDWDADRKKSESRISADGSWRHLDDRDTKLMKGDFNVKTPFKMIESFGADIDFSRDSSQYTGTSILSLNKKKLTTAVTAKRPLSFENAQIVVSAKTPFKKVKDIEFELDHKLNPKFVTVVKSRLGKQETELTLKGENKGTAYQTDVSGSINVKSSMKSLRDVTISLKHKNDNRALQSSASINHNGRKYEGEASMDHSSRRNQVNNNGKFSLTWPEDSVTASWSHRHSGSQELTSSLEAVTGSNRKYFFKVSGTNENEEFKTINGNVEVRTPQYGHMFLTIDHQHEHDKLSHQISVIQNRAQTGLVKLILGKGYKSANAEVQMICPYLEEIHGEGKVDFARYPVTASSFVQWAPRSRMTFDASFNAPSLDNIDFNSKLVTPFDEVENVILKATHQREGQELISHVNLAYGVRKNVDFENRIRFDEDTKLIRTTLTSPCSYMRSLSTGVRLQHKFNGFEADADFEMLPIVKKHDGFMTLKSENGDFDAKMRINTPYREMSSLQIDSYCKSKGASLRSSEIRVEIVPHGVYSLDASYNVDLPYHLDINLNTPHPVVKDLGVLLMLNPQPKNTHAQAKVRYQPHKEIDSEFKLSLEGNVDGSLRVKTPFENYKDNSIILRHDPSRKGFSSHGEIRLGKEQAQADMSYNYGRVKSGTLTITSSLDALEDIKGEFKVRGNVNNLSGKASLNMGRQSVDTTFSNIIRDESVKSSVELSTPFTDKIKVSVNHDDTSSRKAVAFKSIVDASYGSKSFEGTLRVHVDDLNEDSFTLKLKLPMEQVRSIDISLDHNMNSNGISGKGGIRSDHKLVGDINFSYSKAGPLKDMTAKLTLDKNSESLIDLEVETQKPYDEVHGKIVSKGKLLPMLMANLDHKGELSNFNTKTQLSGSEGVVFYNDFTLVIDGDRVDIDGHVNYNLRGQPRSHSIKINKEGSLESFKVDVQKMSDGKEMKGKLEFDSQDKIRVFGEIENVLPQHKWLSAEFECSGDANTFLTTATINLNKNEAISGRVNFYIYETKRIEMTAELTTPFEGYRQSKLEYRHESNNNQFTCYSEVKLGDNKPLTADVTGHGYPDSSVKLILKTPFDNAKEITSSMQFTRKVLGAELDLGRGQAYKANIHYETSPFTHLEVITPCEAMKKLTVYARRDLSDSGPLECDLEILSHGQTISGKGRFDVSTRGKLGFMAELTSDIKDMEQGKVELNLEAKTSELTGNLEVQFNQRQHLYLNGRYYVNSPTWSQKDMQFELEGKMLRGSVRAFSSSLDFNRDGRQRHSKMFVTVNGDKIFDADVNFEDSHKPELTINVRQPRPMEFVVNSLTDRYNREDEVFLNWNRDDPSSNVRVKTAVKGKPGYYNNENSASIVVMRPSRTMGAEYSVTSTSNKMSILGKLTWDKLRDGQASYTLDLTDNSRKGDKSYDGVLKLFVPSRTVGVSGSLSSSSTLKRADAVFSWDMDRDESKQIGVKAAVTESGNRYTNADFSLQLPADVQIATEMILNQGNTIFDGKTDISYCKDSRKTLTVYSKVKNNPKHYSGYFSSANKGYNYSMEMGVSHPDTRLDIQLDSHIGKTQDAMTSSLGIRYLTDRRMVKNMALFAEIDNLKRQIDIVAAGPSKSHRLSGRLVSEDPLEVTMSISEDGDRKFVSVLDADAEKRSITFEIGEPDKLVTIKAFYPNNSALLVELNKKDDLYNYRRRMADQPEALLHLTMAGPRLFRTQAQWQPELLDDLKAFSIDQAELLRVNLRDAILDLNRDIQTEIVAKYQTITSAIVDDSRPFVDFLQTELETVASALDEAMDNVEEMVRDNEFYLGDLDYTVSYLGKVRNAIQEFSRTIRGAISQKLQELRDFPINDAYTTAVSQRLTRLVRAIDDVIVSFIQALKEHDFNLGGKLGHIADKLRESVNLPDLQTIKEKVKRLRNMDMDVLADRLNDALDRGVHRMKQVDLSRLRDSARDWIPDYIKDKTYGAVDMLSDRVSDWDLKQSTKDSVRSALHKLREIVEVELRELESSAGRYYQSPIKSYDPEQGLLVLEVPVPKYPKNMYERFASISMPKFASSSNPNASQMEVHQPIQVFSDEERAYLFDNY